MNVGMDKLDIYNNSAIILDKKTPNKIVSWITILTILLILFIIFSFIPFNIYKPYIGYVEIKGSDTFLNIKLEYSDFPVSKNKKMYIKNKAYKYEVIDIENDIVVIKINLEDNLKLEKNILTINILKDRTTLCNMIKNKIKKGFGA